MKSFLKIFLVVISTLTLFSCRKENWPLTCQRGETYNGTTTAQKLIGTWKYTGYYSIWANTTYEADKDIRITFNADSTFVETSNGVIISQGTWHGLERSITTSPNVLYLDGEVNFCDNMIGFINDYTDGLDYFFRRIK